MLTRLSIAAALLLIALANHARPYQCATDIECEQEEAARCWILCQ